MTALPTFVIISCVAVFLIALLLWLLRDYFTQDSYESQTATGHYSGHQFTTIDDLPEKIGPGRLMVKCQKCGFSYSSGIVGELEMFQRHLERFVNVTTTCPFCKHQNVTGPRNMTYTVS